MWNKKLLWTEISNILSNLKDIPCCLIGDFNAIRSDAEKENCVYKRLDIEGFNDFINRNSLMDLAMINAKFTWFGHQNKKSHLDRALVNPEWFSEGQWSLKAINRKLSDHSGLLLFTDTNDWGPKPFRAFTCWLNDKSLKDRLASTSSDVKGEGLKDVQIILKRYKNVIKLWSKHEGNKVDIKIKQLEDLQLAQGGAQTSIQSSSTKNLLELERLYSIKAQMLKQQSRCKWRIDGDRNNKFFHRIIQKRRSINKIRNIIWDSVKLDAPEDVKMAFFSHYSNLFKNQWPSVFSLHTLFEKILTYEEACWLERDLTIGELDIALNALSKDKAPGPDGLNLECIKFL